MGLLVNSRDGYTLEGRADEVVGLHGPVRFMYRPSVPALMFENDGSEQSHAKILAKQVGTITITENGKDEPGVRLDAEQWMSCHPDIWRRAWDHVMGLRGPYKADGEQEKNSDSASG